MDKSRVDEWINAFSLQAKEPVVVSNFLFPPPKQARRLILSNSMKRISLKQKKTVDKRIIVIV